MSALNQILTIPGMDQTDQLEEIREKSARQSQENLNKIRQDYAKQKMLEALRMVASNEK